MSNFAGFDVPIDEDDGTTTMAPAGVTVKVWNVTADVALAETFTTDASGHVAAGTLAVAAGTVVRFRIENDGHGRAGYTSDMVTS